VASNKSKDVRAGGAFYEIVGKDGLTAVLDRLQKKVAGFGAFARQAGAGALGAGLALATPLAALFRSGVNRAAEIQKMAETFGVATEEVGRFAGAIEAAGGTLGDVESILSTATERNKGRMPLDKYLELVSEGLSKIDAPARRAEAAVDALGAAGHKLLPLLSNPERLKRLMGGAPTIDAATGREAVKTQEALARAWQALQAALLPLAQIILPIVQAVANFARENAGLLRVVAAVAVGLVAVGAAITGVGMVVGLAVKAWSILGVVVGAVLTPLGLVVTTIGGLAALFATQTEAGRAMTSRIGAGFVELKDTAVEAWGGIVAALSSGDLDAAWGIVCAGLKFEWKKVVLYWTEVFQDFTSAFRNAWSDVVDWLAGKIADVVDTAISAWDAVAEAVTGDRAPVRDKLGGAVREDAKREEADRLARQRREREAALAAARAEVVAAGARFHQAVGGAKAMAAAAGPDERHPELLRRPFEAVKGGFNVAAARRQFGYGDTVEAKQLAVLIALNNGNGQLPQKIGQAVANGFRLK
jgi:hypothetical protein